MYREFKLFQLTQFRLWRDRNPQSAIRKRILPIHLGMQIAVKYLEKRYLILEKLVL